MNQIVTPAVYSGADCAKSAAYLSDYLLDKESAGSYEPTVSATNMAFNTSLPYFTWLQRPDNLKTLSRVENGMRASSDFSSQDTMSSGK